MHRYYQPEAETMPVEDIKKLQEEKLIKQAKLVFDKYFMNSPVFKLTQHIGAFSFA